MTIRDDRGFAACGLVCALCSVEDCGGCARMAADHDCQVLACARDKRHAACHLCDDYPCEKGEGQGMRRGAFLRYARENGAERLLYRLKRNEEAGIHYHWPGGMVGDYDGLDSEQAIIDLIDYGYGVDPYAHCPELVTEHFLLRCVSLDDAGDLLSCYSDPLAQPFFNADNCVQDFRIDTLDEMRGLIRFWLEDYNDRHAYLRYSILTRAQGRAVGTIEVFGGEKGDWGVLRVDIASAYEKEAYLWELLALCRRHFFRLVPAGRFVTKAIPMAVERRKALEGAGFSPYSIQGREHYFAITPR